MKIKGLRGEKQFITLKSLIMRNLILLSIFTLSILFNGLANANPIANNQELPPIDTAYTNQSTDTEIQDLGLGWYTSVGVGLSSNRFMSSSLETVSASQNKKALLLDITMGFKIHNRTYVHIAQKYNVITKESDSEEADIDKIFGFEGLGVSHNLSPSQQSAFVSAGIGFSTLRESFEDTPQRGLGVFIGGGYTINKKLHIKAEAIWGNPKDKLFGGSPANPTLSAGVTVGYQL